MTTLRLGDLTERYGQEGRIVDIDPDTGDIVLMHRVFALVRSADACGLRLVERASWVRRYAMKAKAFYLRVRDCGWRYAIEWPN